MYFELELFYYLQRYVVIGINIRIVTKIVNHVCARILLKYTLNVDEENKVGGKLTVWFRSLLSLLGEPT